ncbi:coiled-coil domain-containing protein 191 isoform X2 [Paramormyrops kingsleyae]|uniref:coiled-coil domain-containing protein 191 isoform X2 n=1 Tax=Paramormyrops kingsleyae TaxID=1676925 RepID=UPI003B9791DC
MAHFVPKPDLFRWKRITKNEMHTKAKVNRDDIEHWRQKVEAASQLAMSQVLCGRQRGVPGVGGRGQAIALRNQEQLRDHDDAFREAQTLLSDWMNSKLRLELELGEDERETNSPLISPSEQPGFLQHTNFDDLHSHLEQEADSTTAHTLLWELMQRTAVDCGILEESRLDTEREKRKQMDPCVTMEIHHQQVQERQTWLDAECERRYREEALRREGRRETGRKEGSREAHQQDLRRQEALLEQEVVHLCKEMEEKRNLEQRMRYSTQKSLLWLVQSKFWFWFYSIHGGPMTVLCSCREQERMSRNRSNHVSSPSDPGLSQHSQNSQSSMQQDSQWLHRMQVAEAKAQLQGLRCLQSHFSAWYWAVLQQHLCMGKAVALSDWNRQLRVWRAWLLWVWKQQARRKAEAAEEQLRADNRCCQLALESNRRRLLRWSLAEWQAWCCAQQQQRDVQLGREETRRKMAALVSAAAAGKLGGGQLLAPPSRPGGMHSMRQAGDAGVLPTQHSAPCWLDRDALGNGLIGQQQQQGIKQSVLKEERQKQRMLGLKREAKQEQYTEGPSEQRFLRQTRISRPVPRISQVPSTHPHPVVRAMEERAKLRAERQREVQEMRKRREEEQLQLKAAEEARQREEEQEKQAAVERKREQRRQEKERQLEYQRRAERSRQLNAKALQYRCRALLLFHGLAPWRRLLELRCCQEQLAIEHHGCSVQRSFLFFWARLMSECRAEREACADHLHKHLLLRRGLGGWLKLKNLALAQTLRADEFFRLGTLRKMLVALLVHMTREKLVARKQEWRASEYSDRRVVRRCLRAWQTLPGLLCKEREREQRRCWLRSRVAKILPDFRALPAVTSWDLEAPSHSDI